MSKDTGFKSAEEAAARALSRALESPNKEYGGIVYRTEENKYFFTDPETSGRDHGFKITAKYPKGSKVVGLYHTHPEGKDSSVFSPQDIHVAEQVGVPYYLGVVEDSSMKVFKPGETKVRKKRKSRNQIITYSEGEPFLEDN